MLFFRTADPQGHTFVPAGATRPPTRRQIGSPCRFPPPSVVGFWGTFCHFFVFFDVMGNIEENSNVEVVFLEMLKYTQIAK